jgi:hypothetical protein
MSLIFVKGSNSFSVNDDDVNGVSIVRFTLDGGTPTPEALCTGVDGGSNTEALFGFVGIE